MSLDVELKKILGDTGEAMEFVFRALAVCELVKEMVGNKVVEWSHSEQKTRLDSLIGKAGSLLNELQRLENNKTDDGVDFRLRKMISDHASKDGGLSFSGLSSSLKVFLGACESAKNIYPESRLGRGASSMTTLRESFEEVILGDYKEVYGKYPPLTESSSFYAVMVRLYEHAGLQSNDVFRRIKKARKRVS